MAPHTPQRLEAPRGTPWRFANSRAEMAPHTARNGSRRAGERVAVRDWALVDSLM